MADSRSAGPKFLRRLAEIDRLRAAVEAAILAGRQACGGNPALATAVLPLLTRLDEIGEELDRLGNSRTAPSAGELYPFWIELAQRPPGKL